MNSHRKSFVTGAACGGLGCLAAAAMIGMAEQPAGGARWVTGSNDGRTAYLWDTSGGQVRFVASATAPKAKDENDPNRDAKPEKDGDKPDKNPGKGKGHGGG